ncbi:MAG: glycosyltransferase, partial [Gaiella sp.]
HPFRPWDLRPRGEDAAVPRDPVAWPSVAVCVPAHDEALLLPSTLPALLRQDYPGDWSVVLVDDLSGDGTAATARMLAGGDPRLAVVDGVARPDGWVGKTWALAQAVRAAGEPEWLLLTDADIRHEPHSLRRLVAEAVAGGLVLDSRMALLQARTLPEKLLIPAFAFFFAGLYPMRLVNRGSRRFAAAAGGCVLVRRDALAAAGGIAAIAGQIIDDVSLARRVAQVGRIRLATSRRDVVSLRTYDTLGAVWRMVRRTAFDQLGYSWLWLLLTMLGLSLLFVAPPVLTVWGLAGGAWAVAAAAGGAWLLQTVLYLPAVRHFALSPAWALTLAPAGVLYGLMTADSARLHLLGRDGRW